MKTRLLLAIALAGLLAAAITIITPATAEAGGRPCNTCVSVAPAVVYRDVVREVPVAYPVPFTVAVPVVSYLYNGGGFSYAPVFQAQPTPGMGTVSVAPQTQPQTTDPAVNLTDAQIDTLIARIEARLTARNGGVTTPAPKTAPPSAVPSDVVTILTLKRGNDQRSCADCHTGTQAKGKMVIFSSPGILNPAADWAAIWDVTDTGVMPPETKKNQNAALSDQEVNVLRAKMLEAKASRK